jgi:hypothetical protein
MRQRAHRLECLRAWQREWGSLPKPPGDNNLRWSRVPLRRVEPQPVSSPDRELEK